MMMMMVMMMTSDCQAGRVYFPGPSIGPAPPSLWQSLHTVRQARRLGGEDDGAPELRAAGVRIGQKYSDLDELPLLETQSELRDGGLQPLQDDNLELLPPLEQLDILDPLDIRGDLDVQQDDDHPLPPRDNGVEHEQNSDSLQSLAPLPFLLAAEPRGAEFSRDSQTVTQDLRGFNSLGEGQHSGESVSFGDNQADSGPTSNGFSAPDSDDVISLDEAFELSNPFLVTGQLPEGVVFAAPSDEDVNFNGAPPEKSHPSVREKPLPRRQDLQSSASVLDSTSIQSPEQRPSFLRPPFLQNPDQPRPSAITVAEGPLRSDQNLLNLLVTQGVLRPVGRVRVARLRLVTDDEEQEAEKTADQSVFYSPARSDDGEVILELDDEGGPSELDLDSRRRYREGPQEEITLELQDEGEEDQYEVEDGERKGWQTLTGTNDERQRVLSSNVVPILSEKEVFDRLITPRASTSSTLASPGSDAVSESDEAPVDAESVADELEDRQQLASTPRTDYSLAARLTELGSRVSRQGVWGRRLSGAALRRRTEAVDSGRQDDHQDVRQGDAQDLRQGGWQRRVDIGEPVFVDDGDGDEVEDLDSEGSELHEEVAVLDDEGDVLRQELTGLNDKADERDKEAELDEGGSQRLKAEAEVDEEGTVRWEATSGTTQATRTDIITERTVNFRTDNGIEEGELSGIS